MRTTCWLWLVFLNGVLLVSSVFAHLEKLPPFALPLRWKDSDAEQLVPQNLVRKITPIASHINLINNINRRFQCFSLPSENLQDATALSVWIDEALSFLQRQLLNNEATEEDLHCFESIIKVFGELHSALIKGEGIVSNATSAHPLLEEMTSLFLPGAGSMDHYITGTDQCGGHLNCTLFGLLSAFPTSDLFGLLHLHDLSSGLLNMSLPKKNLRLNSYNSIDVITNNGMAKMPLTNLMGKLNNTQLALHDKAALYSLFGAAAPNFQKALLFRGSNPESDKSTDLGNDSSHVLWLVNSFHMLKEVWAEIFVLFYSDFINYMRDVYDLQQQALANLSAAPSVLDISHFQTMIQNVVDKGTQLLKVIPASGSLSNLNFKAIGDVKQLMNNNSLLLKSRNKMLCNITLGDDSLIRLQLQQQLNLLMHIVVDGTNVIHDGEEMMQELYDDASNLLESSFTAFQKSWTEVFVCVVSKFGDHVSNTYGRVNKGLDISADLHSSEWNTMKHTIITGEELAEYLPYTGFLKFHTLHDVQNYLGRLANAENEDPVNEYSSKFLNGRSLLKSLLLQHLQSPFPSLSANWRGILSTDQLKKFDFLNPEHMFNNAESSDYSTLKFKSPSLLHRRMNSFHTLLNSSNITNLSAIFGNGKGSLINYLAAKQFLTAQKLVQSAMGNESSILSLGGSNIWGDMIEMSSSFDFINFLHEFRQLIDPNIVSNALQLLDELVTVKSQRVLYSSSLSMGNSTQEENGDNEIVGYYDRDGDVYIKHSAGAKGSHVENNDNEINDDDDGHEVNYNVAANSSDYSANGIMAYDEEGTGTEDVMVIGQSFDFGLFQAAAESPMLNQKHLNFVEFISTFKDSESLKAFLQKLNLLSIHLSKEKRSASATTLNTHSLLQNFGILDYSEAETMMKPLSLLYLNEITHRFQLSLVELLSAIVVTEKKLLAAKEATLKLTDVLFGLKRMTLSSNIFPSITVSIEAVLDVLNRLSNITVNTEVDQTHKASIKVAMEKVLTVMDPNNLIVVPTKQFLLSAQLLMSKLIDLKKLLLQQASGVLLTAVESTNVVVKDTITYGLMFILSSKVFVTSFIFLLETVPVSIKLLLWELLMKSIQMSKFLNISSETFITKDLTGFEDAAVKTNNLLHEVTTKFLSKVPSTDQPFIANTNVLAILNLPFWSLFGKPDNEQFVVNMINNKNVVYGQTVDAETAKATVEMVNESLSSIAAVYNFVNKDLSDRLLRNEAKDHLSTVAAGTPLEQHKTSLLKKNLWQLINLTNVTSGLISMPTQLSSILESQISPSLSQSIKGTFSVRGAKPEISHNAAAGGGGGDEKVANGVSPLLPGNHLLGHTFGSAFEMLGSAIKL